MPRREIPHRGKKRQRIGNNARRGAAAVEFAVVAPLFFLLLAGIVEFGQAFHIEHMLSNACRRGARAAVVQGSTSARVQEKVKAQCVESLGVRAEDVAVEITVNGNAGGDLSQAEEGAEIGVTVSIAYSQAGIGFFAKMFSNATLSSTCILEHE